MNGQKRSVQWSSDAASSSSSSSSSSSTNWVLRFQRNFSTSSSSSSSAIYMYVAKNWELGGHRSSSRTVDFHPSLVPVLLWLFCYDVVTCEIKLFQNYFSLRRHLSEIILFQHAMETCLKLFQSSFSRWNNFISVSDVVTCKIKLRNNFISHVQHYTQVIQNSSKMSLWERYKLPVLFVMILGTTSDSARRTAGFHCRIPEQRQFWWIALRRCEVKEKLMWKLETRRFYCASNSLPIVPGGQHGSS